MKTEKLRFTEDAKVDKKIIYHKGKIYDVPVDTGSSQRWIKRGIAHTVVEEVKTPAVEESPKKIEVVIENTPELFQEVLADQSGEESAPELEAVKAPEIEEDVAKEKPKKENKNKKNPGKGL
jgi:hypothetical protein